MTVKLDDVLPENAFPRRHLPVHLDQLPNLCLAQTEIALQNVCYS